MGDQNIRVSPEWEHSLTNLLGHDPTTQPGIALRQWVHHQSVLNHLDLLSWDEEEIKANPTQQIFSLYDHGQGSFLKTNQLKQICGLITYIKHVFNEYMEKGDWENPFHPLSLEEWSKQTSTMMRLYLVQNLPTPIGPQPVTSGPIPSSKPTTYSPAALELISFKNGIKREITAYPSLKDERYFDGFKRSLFIVAKTHECSDVLDPNYTPVVNLKSKSFLRLNRPSCLVSSTPTSRLTWERPLSGGIWLPLMPKLYGKSLVSISRHPQKEPQKRGGSPNMSPILF